MWNSQEEGASSSPPPTTGINDLLNTHFGDLNDNRLKKTIFIGGLDEELVDRNTLSSTFEVFGPIRTVELPMNRTNGKHRGFAFIEYEDANDAQEAIENMDGSELNDRILTVNLTKNINNGEGEYVTRPPWIAEYLKRQQTTHR